jgi:acetylornithine deacetylase/succinyl-diaminopimelate desuccinylase-like protein
VDAGTTPMERRRGALVAASELIRGIRALPAVVGGSLVATVGKLGVWPNAVNVVPSFVEIWVDLRTPPEQAIAAAEKGLEREVQIVRSKGSLR